MEDVYDVCLSSTEIQYLQIYYISQFRNEISVKDYTQAKDLAIKLIDQWENTLGHNFENDVVLLENLTDHLVPALMRFKHGIFLENVILSEIRKIHKNTFLIVEKSKWIIEEAFETEISDHELSFLVLHLASAIDRLKKPLNVLLVSHVGLGARILLKERLTAKIPEIRIKKTANYFAAYDEILENYDLILSTIALKRIKNVPVIEINPLIHPSDIEGIRKMIIPLYNKKNDPYEMDTHNE